MAEEPSPQLNERKRLANEVLDRFFIYSRLDSLVARLDASKAASAQLLPLVDAFKSNLRAVVVVAQLPFLMTERAVHQRRFQQLLTAERIRALSDNRPESENLRIANERMDEEVKSGDFKEHAVDHVIDDLRHLIQDDHFALSVRELHRQATVLIWGALEVLARDLFTLLLNNQPHLATRLINDERTKKRFVVRDSIVDLTSEFGFDLSRSMGDVLTRYHDISDLPCIREVFDVLTSGDGVLRGLLQHQDIWLLFQRRNLILHRRAVVDAAYLSRTSDTLQLGSELVVTPDEVERYLELTAQAGTEIINRSIDVLKPS